MKHRQNDFANVLRRSVEITTRSGRSANVKNLSIILLQNLILTVSRLLRTYYRTENLYVFDLTV